MRTYTQVSGVLFAFVAFGHLVRVVRGWPLLIAGRPLPVVVSVMVLIVAAAMAIWAGQLLRTPEKP